MSFSAPAPASATASAAGPSAPAAPESEQVQIREVWQYNLEAEFDIIRNIVEDYPYVALDTEFPGVVVYPARNGVNSHDAKLLYSKIKLNVDILDLIQLGLAFSDAAGRLPRRGDGGRPCVWQFNFREFNPLASKGNLDSIRLLVRSGIDLNLNHQCGVASTRFAELLMSSGVVLNADITWIAFHAGFDFAYLLKALTGTILPETRGEFFELVQTFFPVVYDVRQLMIFTTFTGGLSSLANKLGVERVGIAHQAGSDGLMTAGCFKQLKDTKLEECFLKRSVGMLYELGHEAFTKFICKTRRCDTKWNHYKLQHSTNQAWLSSQSQTSPYLVILSRFAVQRDS